MRLYYLFLSATLSATLCASGAAPSIQSVVNGASYGPAIASATWTAITGSNFSTTTRTWGNADFNGANLPTSLEGIQVTINGKAAYVYFISPGQINVLAPDDATVGTVAVQVTNSQGTSLPFMVNKQAAAPALFAYSQLNGVYAIAQAVGTYSLVAPPGLAGGAVLTYTASPGENLILYATGLGATSPAQTTGQIVSTAAPVAGKTSVTIGGQPATVQFAGLIGSGLYQINVVVPLLPTGDAAIVLSVRGQASTQSVSLPVQAFISPTKPTLPQLSGCVTGQVDYITYLIPQLSIGQADTASIGGTPLCSTCSIKAPIYPEFALRMERAIQQKETVQACFDASGTIYQLKLTHP